MTKDEGRLVTLVETIAASGEEADGTPSNPRSAQVLREVSRELRQPDPQVDSVLATLISGSGDAL